MTEVRETRVYKATLSTVKRLHVRLPDLRPTLVSTEGQDSGTFIRAGGSKRRYIPTQSCRHGSIWIGTRRASTHTNRPKRESWAAFHPFNLTFLTP